MYFNTSLNKWYHNNQLLILPPTYIISHSSSPPTYIISHSSSPPTYIISHSSSPPIYIIVTHPLIYIYNQSLILSPTCITNHSFILSTNMCNQSFIHSPFTFIITLPTHIYNHLPCPHLQSPCLPTFISPSPPTFIINLSTHMYNHPLHPYL